jgi:hypothetical protein
MTSLPVRARSVLLVAVILIALTACNPLSLRFGNLAPAVRYVGPSGGWLEVSVAGIEGFDVNYQILASGDEPWQRLCRDAATGEIEECDLEFALNSTDPYIVTSTAFRPAIMLRDADRLSYVQWCTRDGATVDCPSRRATLRVVDGNGHLMGDLRQVPERLPL